MLNQRSLALKRGDFLDQSSHNSVNLAQGNQVIKPPVAPGLKKNPSVKRINLTGHNVSLNYNSTDSTSNINNSSAQRLHFDDSERLKRSESPIVPPLNLQNPKSVNLGSEIRSEITEVLKSGTEQIKSLNELKFHGKNRT